MLHTHTNAHTHTQYVHILGTHAHTHTHKREIFVGIWLLAGCALTVNGLGGSGNAVTGVSVYVCVCE